MIDARAIVVTNIFRDQLDRYGEVTHTLNSIKIGISHSPKATLCLNADDSMVASIADDFKNKVVYFGVNVPIYKKRVQEVSDAPFCIKCKHEYVYDYVTYGHLGGYRCPNCGYHRPTPDVAVVKVLQSDASKSVVDLTVDGTPYRATINLPGGYNIYNACGTVAVGRALKLDMTAVIRSLSEFAPGFGRMEKLVIDGTPIRMILVKNPAGCNQVLNFVTNVSEPSVFVVCLNDRDADGTDISWIWDVDFEKIAEMGSQLKGLFLSGVRADEMALRFKYAGIPEEKMKVIKDYETLMKTCAAQKCPVYIMPTYTAMMDLRNKITKMYDVKNFWE
jgi:UDP-N-acetylmuramyl tripeptide synthase